MKLAAFIFGAVPLVIQMFARKYESEDLAATLDDLEGDFGLPRIKAYDFIVVGGGSAGCIVAGRLSERFNVLLLEAGGSPVPQSDVPYYSFEVAEDVDTNYFYYSVPQRNMSLESDGIVRMHTGKMLGGSASHNEMVHQRGSPKDWDNYATIMGDPSWRYENILPFFKKSEDFVGDLLQPDQTDYYGTGGPMRVNTHIPPFYSKWAEAGLELGFPSMDSNGMQMPSVTPFQVLLDGGRRVSSYTGYIKPHEGVRQNLTVIRYSSVTKVLINENNIAYGVTYLRHGIPQIAHARNEIILSAGAVNSPLILMMSGIGPRDQLEEANIPVIVNLPSVGDNFNDHIWFLISDFKFNSSADAYIPRIPESELETEITRYHETGEGPLGELQEGPQLLFASTRAIQAGQADWADGKVAIDPACPLVVNDDQETRACFFVEIGRPRSKGTLKLNTTAYLDGSTNFVDLAVIDFKGLSDESDMDVFLEGVDLAFRFANSSALRSLGMEYVGTPIPACASFPFMSQEYWRCFAQQGAKTGIHIVGTCAAGPNGPGSVVDSKFRVKGIAGLRVVDASVLPLVPNANINGAVIAVGEKAADEITRDWI